MSSRVTLIALLVLLSAGRLSGQVPLGGEFRVNTLTTLDHYTPSVASDAAGNLVVVLTSVYLTDRDVHARRYDASGAPRGAEFQVNTDTSRSPGHPVVASDPAGNFVVVWSSLDMNGAYGLFGQRYDFSGTARGSEFRVGTYTTFSERLPSVASDAAGNFVVAWQEYERDGEGLAVVAQRFDASGDPRGSDFQVNTSTTLDQDVPSVSMDAAGNFIVVWTSQYRDSLRRCEVFGQRYDASGAPLGGEFRVNSYTTHMQAHPSVASDPAGNFVVVWQSWYQDGSQYGIFGQRYDASGAPRGSEFRVSSSGANEQVEASVALDAAGNFLVVWKDYCEPQCPGRDGSGSGIFAQRFEASGARVGTEFQVNTYTTSVQQLSSVASDAVGNMVVVWNGLFQHAEHTRSDVVGQRYGFLQPAGLVVDPSSSNDSDGDGVLEPGESVEVRPAFRNVNGLSRIAVFGGVASSLAGPPAGGVSYQLQDAAASYGPIANGDSASCHDCYRVGVTFAGGRPALPWDATRVEELGLDPLGQAMSRPLHLADSFVDVPRTSAYYRFVETLLHKGVTGGCAADSYCPASAVTREQMAVFVLVAMQGSQYLPTTCNWSAFADVPQESPFCRWIAELKRRGVVSGCGGGNYCPTEAVTREQMSVFLLRTLDPALSPPACTTPVFGDVPSSSPFCRYVEELARRGITSGCGGGNYCPAAPVTREQMAVFITATFGLSLYGP